MNDRYKIADEFCDGLACGIRPSAVNNEKSEHWHAGYSAGYAMRAEKSRRLNEYLTSIGLKPMGVVRLQ